MLDGRGVENVRRAQAAAEAARPMRSEWKRCCGNIASGIGRQRTARRNCWPAPALDGSILCSSSPPASAAWPARSTRRSCGWPASTINRSWLSPKAREVKILTVGKKGFEQLRRNYEKQIVDRVELRGVRVLGYVNAPDIANKVIALFERGEFDVATLFYSRFKSVISQIPTAQQIIPPKFEAVKAEGAAASYEYEPEEDEILADLLPRYVATQIFRALLENNASFYGSQMSAMDNATRNAGDMIKNRPSNITARVRR